MKKDFFVILSLVLVFIGSSFVFYQCEKSATGTPGEASTYKSQKTKEVLIQNKAFNPDSITVDVNTTVKWTNKDAAVYTVTSANGLFDSGNMGKGVTFSYQFNNAGTYSYKCSFDPGMTGTVIVQK